jgi:hypothetical protein
LLFAASDKVDGVEQSDNEKRGIHMAINQSTLLEKAAQYRESLYEDNKKLAGLGKAKSAFLCHSHDDKKLVEGLIVLFNQLNIELFVDWKVPSMHDTPNAATAKKIQDAIRSYELFLFLATAKSKASRWCPWEIGYADSSKRRILILCTVDGAGTYGNEYLQLYEKIDSTIPGGKLTGLSLYAVGSMTGAPIRAGRF